MKIKRILKTKLFPIALVAITLLLLVNTTALAADSWTTVASMSRGRCYHQTEVIDGKIYAIGGSPDGSAALSSVEVYDPDTDTWTIRASMPQARRFLQTEVIDGKIYAVGGYNSGNYKSVWVYDPATDTWTTLASMSQARSDGFKTVVLDGRIYAIGGYLFSSVEVYDPATDIWTTLASMETKRFDFQVEVLDGKIYAIGGHTGRIGLSSIDVYNPDTDTWTTLASMSTARRGFQTEVIGGKIYAIGGYCNSNIEVSSVEVYDPDNDTWTTLASMSTVRQNFRTEVVGGKIYAIGGTTGSGLNSLVEAYDPSTNIWTDISSLTLDRTYFETQVLGSKIYAIGGQNHSCLSSVERYTVTTTPDPTPNVPANLTATAGDKQVTLNWTAATDAVSYNVYRSTTSGGPYTSIASDITGTTYTDTGLTNGTTYYYVVKAVNSSGTESAYSNEASATPTASATYNATLEITMVTGEIKEYSVTSTVVEDFIDWFYNKASVCPYYVFRKTSDLGPYTNRTEYLAYDKISSFEVFEY